MTRQQALDLYFMEARSKVIELAAFLDRVERSDGTADFRYEALREAIRTLDAPGGDAARRVLTALSDPTTDPVPAALGKGAVGAWPGAADR